MPALLLLLVALVAHLITGSMEISVTVAVAGLAIALFTLLWSLGTAAVGLLIIVVKVVV